jgi:hypothetical protein
VVQKGRTEGCTCCLTCSCFFSAEHHGHKHPRVYRQPCACRPARLLGPADGTHELASTHTCIQSSGSDSLIFRGLCVSIFLSSTSEACGSRDDLDFYLSSRDLDACTRQARHCSDSGGGAVGGTRCGVCVCVCLCVCVCVRACVSQAKRTIRFFLWYGRGMIKTFLSEVDFENVRVEFSEL